MSTNAENFWKQLKKPFFVLAPMANVTDFTFRKIVANCGRPDVFYTEFLSCDGIVFDKSKFQKELYFEKSEKPIVVQFFGSKPENFYKCAQLAQKFGFDGIDINMGCPDRTVEKQGAGAALINNPKLTQEIIKETKRGAGNLPVSIKTRIGYNKIVTEEWMQTLLEAGPALITIHGRTRKEMSSVPTHWDEIGKAANIVKTTNTLIVGNGDIANINEAKEKAKKYNLDGIMIGRGVFSNPWFFNKNVDPEAIKPNQKIELLMKHLDLFTSLWDNPSASSGQVRNFDTLKKFFKVYIANWPGAKDLRSKLMQTKNSSEVVEIVTQYKTANKGQYLGNISDGVL